MTPASLVQHVKTCPKMAAGENYPFSIKPAQIDPIPIGHHQARPPVPPHEAPHAISSAAPPRAGAARCRRASPSGSRRRRRRRRHQRQGWVRAREEAAHEGQGRRDVSIYKFRRRKLHLCSNPIAFENTPLRCR